MKTSSMLQKATRIYKWLEDDESTNIFELRLLYSVTNNMECIDKIVKKYLPTMQPLYLKENSSQFLKFIKDSDANGKKIIIYGAGKVGQIVNDLLRNVKIECFSDINSDLQASGVNGIPVISPEALASHYSKNSIIVLAVWKKYHDDLTNYFVSNGMARENIINGLEFMNFQGNFNNQYFEPSLIDYVDNEIFVDAGCFDFNSSLNLAQRCDTINKIYAFEPDIKNMAICRNKVNEFDQCEVRMFEAGLWSCNDTLNFNLYGGGGSSIVKSGNSQVTVVPLDDVVEEDGVTFIKMDIEGAELEALKGAIETLKRFKPKLAISLYHKPEDILDIPEFILDLNLGYKLYIRHYTNWNVDTILYALQ